jgi:HEAT repeat protein
MDATNIKELIARYNAGVATTKDVKEIEKLIEKGTISISDLSEMQALEDQLLNAESPVPPLSMDDKFYEMLVKEKRAARGFDWSKFFSLPEFLPRVSLAAVTLILGLVGGYFLRTPEQQQSGSQIKALTEQVTEMKEMMMLTLLEKESASDRLKAVSLSSEMGQASDKVTAALLQTLNSDENVNVRLAALDALRPYTKNSDVRQEIIRSIAKQQSPLVQVALAELMVDLQDKSSVKELQKILKDKKTPLDVKKKIEQSIDVLI